MKKNKFVKLIEHLLVALPLLYVGVTSAYTIFNPNAKASYSDYMVKDLVTINSGTDIVNGNTYYFSNYFGENKTYASNFNFIVFYSNIDFDFKQQFRLTNVTEDIIGFDFNVYNSSMSSYGHYWYIDDDNVLHQSNIYYWSYEFLPDSFTIVADTSYNSFSWNNVLVNTYLTTSGTLNNVMTFAMSEFNKLGFNKIPFTSFFVNIFHNGETNVYIDFVNNYLNYMLFVECSYFVPMILYWFIHLGEDVVDRFTRKGDKL